MAVDGGAIQAFYPPEAGRFPVPYEKGLSKSCYVWRLKLMNK
jgi:hypothetical protein